MTVRVFHFILDHRVGGPHTYVRAVAQALAPEIVSTVVTTGKGPLTDESLTNLRHYSKWLYPVEVGINILRLCWKFRKANSRAEVVFDVHGAANIAPIVAGRILGVPIVWHFHEMVSDFGGLVRIGKSVLAGSRYRYVAVAAKAVDMFALQDATLIPGGVNPDFWSVAPDTRVHGRSNQRMRLVAVGNLNPLKGLDVLLGALSNFTSDWELMVIGAELTTYSQFSRSLHEAALRLASPTRFVKFLGWQPPEQIRELLLWSDAFVLPSRSEACPIALLEAMSMECLCIATDVGDVKKIIGGDDVGVVIRSEDPAKLTSALGFVAMMSTEERRHMGGRARQRIIQDYSDRRMAQQHLKIYRELVIQT